MVLGSQKTSMARSCSGLKICHRGTTENPAASRRNNPTVRASQLRLGHDLQTESKKAPDPHEVHRSSAPGGGVRTMHQQHQRAIRGRPTAFYYRAT